MIPDFERRKAKYPPIAAILHEVFGYPDWRPSLPPVDELVSCILSQSTSDTNSGRAFDALKARYPTWEAVRDAPLPELVRTIRSAGLANQKAPRIQAALRVIEAERGAIELDFLNDLPLEEAKAWLMRLNGVGPKTAAIVLCFAFNRPAFPVDTHIHRVGQRIGFLPEGISADAAHPVMEAIVPPDAYYAFHLNLIWHGREICHARAPQCERCPIAAFCDYYQRLTRP
ncbi:MAG: endonuclease III [Chloroflexi bacterium]|nr:endonuclease III [Chloroflexota bacterium]